jgi:hypothetical protein
MGMMARRGKGYHLRTALPIGAAIAILDIC